MNNDCKFLWFFFASLLFWVNISCTHGKSGQDNSVSVSKPSIQVGAENLSDYVPYLFNKSVGVVANQTSTVGPSHLVDTLLSIGINIKAVFAPEHGFRGEAGAGEKIKNGLDPKTNIAIISLYGKHLKPTKSDLEGIDVVLFDIQDVGARFYTYISTLQYVMEACAESGISLIVLDRPNPNGFYVDGPVLNSDFKSFVGMNQIPVVHGMTIGEYAKMLVGEKWFEKAEELIMTIVHVSNYSHNDLYQLPIRPSPNLPNMQSVYLYPSLCFFEGTHVSLGRGTDFPFQCFGFPGMKNVSFSFTPSDIPGVASNPPYRDTLCNGIDLRNFNFTGDNHSRRIELSWLLQSYSLFPDKKNFFNPFFEKLAGTDLLRKQILNGSGEEEIRKSWQADLNNFKKIRKKYLLYPDFVE